METEEKVKWIQDSPRLDVKSDIDHGSNSNN